MQYFIRTVVSCALVAVLGVAAAASEPVPGKVSKAKAPAKKAPAKVVAAGPPAATAEQIEAAQNVYYGAYECELQQPLAVAASARFPAYVDVTFGKRSYLMKPVLSATGAIRLEHTQGEALLVQIATKSMLLNVKTGQRIVDECIGATQRHAIEVAKRAAAEAKAAADAASAPGAASVPAAPSVPGAASAPAPATPPPAASAPAATSVPDAAVLPPAAASAPSRPQ